MKQSKTLIFGRLQPLHEGHTQDLIDFSVKELLKEGGTLFIGITKPDGENDGSSKEFARNNAGSNPFTFEERKALVENYLKTNYNGLAFQVIKFPIDDDEALKEVLAETVANDSELNLLVRKDGNDDWSNEKERRIKETCTNVSERINVVVKLNEKDRVTATAVRESLVKGNGDWKKWVPECNHDLVQRSWERKISAEN